MRSEWSHGNDANRDNQIEVSAAKGRAWTSARCNRIRLSTSAINCGFARHLKHRGGRVDRVHTMAALRQSDRDQPRAASDFKNPRSVAGR